MTLSPRCVLLTCLIINCRQIMDPKMDSGIDAEGVYTFEEAQKASLLPAELTIPQVIAIMDKMLCCEVPPTVSLLCPV